VFKLKAFYFKHSILSFRQKVYTTCQFPIYTKNSLVKSFYSSLSFKVIGVRFTHMDNILYCSWFLTKWILKICSWSAVCSVLVKHSILRWTTLLCMCVCYKLNHVTHMLNAFMLFNLHFLLFIECECYV